MENHGCKGCLTPSLCINYPPNLDFFKKVFSVSFCLSEYCLDKIKVGGDSCLPQHFDYKKSVHRITELATLLGMLSNKRGVTLEFRITLIIVCLLALFFKVVVGFEWKMNPIPGFKNT